VNFIRLNNFSGHVADFGVQKRSGFLSCGLEDVQNGFLMQAGEPLNGTNPV